MNGFSPSSHLLLTIAAPLVGAVIAWLLGSRGVSATEVTQRYLKHLHSTEGRIQSFIALGEESALAAAAAVDSRLAKGEHLPLAGVPIAVKV